MVKRKKTSKRAPIRRQYSVAKKIKDHNRKLKKLARENPDKIKPKKKDPGVPNLWPYKEQLLSKIEKDREIEDEEKKKKKEAKKKNAEKKRKASLAQNLMAAAMKSGEHIDTASQMAVDEDKSADDEWKSMKTDTGSRRWYFKEVKQVIEQADIILEVLDARDPQGCRALDIEKHILSQMGPDGSPSKRLILVINKIDLVPGEILMKWVKYLRREFPTVAFKSSTQKKGALGEMKVKPTVASKSEINYSGCIGGNILIQLLKNYSRIHKKKLAITVGVIGYPNVGKSSIINSLKRQRAVNVGATPGVTKTLQYVTLDKQVNLIDSPGVLFAAGKEDDKELVLRNCLKAENIEDPQGVASRIVEKCSMEKLCQVYNIPAYKDADEFLEFVSKQKCQMKKGGVMDTKVTALRVIQDWNSGKIEFYTTPPVTHDIETTEIVQWSKDFGIEQADINKSDEEALTSATKALSGFTIL